MTALSTPPPTAADRVHRIEVWPRTDEHDTHGRQAMAVAQAVLPGLSSVRTARVFLIAAPLDPEQLRRVAEELLADPVSQHAVPAVGQADDVAGSVVTVEVHPQPGVMDPVADSTASALRDMFPHLHDADFTVRTGKRYDFHHDGQVTTDTARAFAESNLGNPVIESFFDESYRPESFPAGQHYDLNVGHVALRGLDDDGLRRLSRDAHLFLSLEEMQTIREHFRSLPGDREPTDIELETLAQTWSEHCVHKTLKSTVTYKPSNPGHGDCGGVALEATPDRLAIFRDKPGHTVNPDGTVTIHNLLKSTVAAATFALRDRAPEQGGKGDWLVSVFDDNAGIVKLDDTHGIAVKVETHNHPSAIEPYGGAATGIGGCIRDIMGTGLAAKPIANTDTFAVAPPSTDQATIPAGVISPKRVLERVVAGVRDYGNRMGIPTVNGTVLFHDDYLANPLVFAGCVGLIPLDKCFGDVKAGDRIIALGGRTGRDGIHGATFSSAELTDTHADEFGHAVQIGNAITEKQTLDAILAARDHEDGTLFSAITDCGAGGFSSAIGEMGEKVGADVQLDAAPLKYDGLTYAEVWISEAQERMVLSVPAENLDMLQAICDAEDVELSDLGTFGHADDAGTPILRLNFRGTVVGELPMPLLHGGIPMPTREATWPPEAPTGMPQPAVRTASPTLEQADLKEALLGLLAHPNIASKHWVVRQYDHEVQGGSVVKPLVGPQQLGPSDAAVIRPKLESNVGIALSNGVCPWLSETITGGDSYQATLHAIDEAVRNAVCTGADPQRIAILDNFCWPSCDDPTAMGTLVRAAEACYDGALAYGTPYVSGKDSLHNQFTTEDGRLIAIPPTLLVTALGIVPDVTKAVTMDAKRPGNALFIVGATGSRLGGSHVLKVLGHNGGGPIPTVDIEAGPKHAALVAALIADGCVRSAHDCSEGGLLVAAAEMAFAGNVGLDLDLTNVPTGSACGLAVRGFAESAGRYLLEVSADHVDAVVRACRNAGVPFAQVGTFAQHDRLTTRDANVGQVLDVPLVELLQAWRGTLDW